MTVERFEEIMAEVNYDFKKNARIFAGLTIMSKYLPNVDIEAAEHDIVYACEVSELVSSGISEEDAKALSVLGWHIAETSLAHFA